MKRQLTVVMDLTERCNLRCIMCYFSSVDRLQFPPYDQSLSTTGNMPPEVFASIAADLFPNAWRVALGCAAEPLIHPKFHELVEIAGRYRVPDLWFPTNLLALTPRSAEAIVRAKVATVAVSIDGTDRETYEKIRVGGKWERLLANLELLRSTREEHHSRSPELRVIFTWMRSNYDDLLDLPRFAQEIGASEIDVRYVTPTVGVDVTEELLSGVDPVERRSRLATAARDAVSRGLRLASYPEFETAADLPRTLVGRLRRRAWRMRAGIDRAEYRRHARQQREEGCAYPARTVVVRPNGAVSPCTYWDGTPIGMYPETDLATIVASEGLLQIRDGLANGSPIGTCSSCGERRDAFYRPETATTR